MCSSRDRHQRRSRKKKRLHRHPQQPHRRPAWTVPWHQKNKASKDCTWTKDNASKKNCKKKDGNKIKASDACPSACGSCDLPPSCSDDGDWHVKKKAAANLRLGIKQPIRSLWTQIGRKSK